MSENVLTRNQRRALAALLACKSIVDAAASCGLAEKTLARYLADPVFRAALARMEGDAIDQATRRLLGLQDAAIDTLANTLDDPQTSASIRLRAAQAVLDYLLKLRELRDIEQRLAGLEAAIYGSERKQTPYRP